MFPIPILVIGRNEAILSTVVKLINANREWSAIGAQSDTDAIALIHTNTFSLVLFTNGIDAASEDLLRSHILGVSPDTAIVQHYGGGSGLLSNEIMYALHLKNP